VTTLLEVEPLPEFKAWPKTPRLNRGMVITEKIDGTNACVIVTEEGLVYAQSRKQMITPVYDNFGFAKWVYENVAGLANTLGPGYHYGEWWGSGIQRGYGLPKGEKRFSLFNTSRWDPGLAAESGVPGLHVVPVLYEGMFDTREVETTVRILDAGGSVAAPGFMRPEGVIVFHSAANQVFKVTVENDESPKGLAE
jgi:hypothetical protein